MSGKKSAWCRHFPATTLSETINTKQCDSDVAHRQQHIAAPWAEQNHRGEAALALSKQTKNVVKAPSVTNRVLHAPLDHRVADGRFTTAGLRSVLRSAGTQLNGSATWSLRNGSHSGSCAPPATTRRCQPPQASAGPAKTSPTSVCLTSLRGITQVCA